MSMIGSATSLPQVDVNVDEHWVQSLQS